MNNTPYKDAWLDYVGSTEYVRSAKAMEQQGMKYPYIQNILMSAFENGWNSRAKVEKENSESNPPKTAREK